MEGPLADPLTNALFKHHRELAAPALVAEVNAPKPKKVEIIPTRKALAQPLTLVDEIGLRRPTLHMIISAVCKFYRVSFTEFVGDTRAADVVRARHIGIYLCRTLTGKSVIQIGRYVSRDHSTIIHACHRATAKIRANDRLRDEVEVLKLNILQMLQDEAA